MLPPQSLLKFMSTELVILSNHLILCCALFLLPSIFPRTRIFFSESVHCIWWPKFWCFSFSISPSNEYSGLISFRMDWLDLLAVHRTLNSLLQHHSSKASVLQCSAFFMVQLSHLYMTAAFDSTGLCWVCSGASIKTQKGGVQRASGLVSTQRCWEGGRPGEGTEGLCPLPLTLPLASLPPGCSWDVPFYNKSAIEDINCFPEVCELLQLILSIEPKGQTYRTESIACEIWH